MMLRGRTLTVTALAVLAVCTTHQAPLASPVAENRETPVTSCVPGLIAIWPGYSFGDFREDTALLRGHATPYGVHDLRGTHRSGAHSRAQSANPGPTGAAGLWCHRDAMGDDSASLKTEAAESGSRRERALPMSTAARAICAK